MIQRQAILAFRLSTRISHCPKQGNYPSRIASLQLSPLHRQFTTRSNTTLSRREIADLEDKLSVALGRLKDPILDKDLKTLGWLPKRLTVQDDGQLVLTVQLPSLLHPNLEELKRQVEATVHALLHDRSVIVTMQPSTPFPAFTSSTDQHTEYLKTLGPGLAHVSHCLAVYSCKGGVGKSTVAVNLAYELARQGGRVGLLDVDIYGPSLPILVHPDDPAVRKSTATGKTNMVLPIEHGGVKLLSLGFVSPDSGVPGSGNAGGAAVMRGPMAGRVVSQLLKGTDWGDLDVLVLDLPPGTGDVQLAICQDLRLTGAVAVTTPSKLALSDAKKGIDMFTSLGVPTIAVVENMSYFVCDGGGKHYPFGTGHLEADLPNVFQLPISTVTNDANDSGVPLALARPEEASAELEIFHQLGISVARELFLSQHGLSSSSTIGVESSQPHRVRFPSHEDEFDVASTHVTMTPPDGFLARFFSDKGAMQVTIPAESLRVRHAKTGEILVPEGMVQQNSKVLPAKLNPKGRYGYAVEWADGATIIYSMFSIAKAAGATPISPSSTT